MANQGTIAPLGLFTRDALQAGWYLAVRVLPWTFGYVLIGFAAAFVLIRSGLVFPGAFIFATAVIAAFGVFVKRSGAITSQWAESRWGHALPDDSMVWLTITWRALLVAGVVMWPVSMAMVFAPGWLPSLLALGATVPVLVLATGHAMSKVAAAQLADREPAPRSAPTRSPVPVRSPAAPPATRSPAPQRAPRVDTAAEPKLRCPECGRIEVARGPVIGWQCGACNWRGPRPADATPSPTRAGGSSAR